MNDSKKAFEKFMRKARIGNDEWFLCWVVWKAALQFARKNPQPRRTRK